MSTLKASNIQPQSDSDPLILSTNATQRLRIDTTGKVGIGTASPGSALEVQSFVSSVTAGGITGTVANAGILLNVDMGAPTATQYSSGLFWRDSAITTLPLAGIWVGDENSNGSSLLFGTSQTYGNGINKIGMTVRNGLVGIGVTGPEAALDVSGGSAKQIWIRSGSGGGLNSAAGAGMKLEYVGASNSGNIQPYDYSTSTAKNLTLCVLGGNVGIRTASPSVALDVVGAIKSDTSLTLGSSTLAAPTGTPPMFAARAWAYATTPSTSVTAPTLVESENISSVAYVSVNVMRFTFITAMPDANYSVVYTASRVGGSKNTVVGIDTKTTTYFDVIAEGRDGSNSMGEAGKHHVIVFR